MLLVFGVIMVVLIGCLLVVQVAFGSIAEEEPQMINPRSLAVSAFLAGGLAYAFTNREPGF